jgi:MFS family permease
VTSIAAYDSLSATDHSRELRKAVIAATVGTTIEWYDFFLYGTAAGLVFGKLYFPNSDPTTGTLLAFSTYFVGFAARPIGAAIFGHYGDRIGRKATLIATLLLMGIATFLIAFVPTYDSIGIWGGIILTVLRAIQGIGVGGEWGGSVLLSMEWSRSGRHNRGFLASWPQFGVPAGLFLATIIMLGATAWSGDQFLTWGWRVPFVLSIILVGTGLWIRLGILETPVFQKLLNLNKIERAPIVEVIKKQPKEVCLSALLRMGQQSPFYIFTAFVFAYGVGTLHMSRDQRRVGRLVHFVDHDATLRPHLGPHRSEKDVSPRHRSLWAVRLSLFRHAGHRDSVGGVPRYRGVPHPARYDVWPTGCADRRSLYAAAQIQRLVARLSVRVGDRRRTGAADSDGTVRGLSHRLRHRHLPRGLRRDQLCLDGVYAGLYRQGCLQRIRRLTFAAR